MKIENATKCEIYLSQQHCEVSHFTRHYREVEQEDVDAADFVLTGPSNAGNVTDEEEEDDEIFNYNGLPGEVSGETEVVTRSIEPSSNN